MMPALCPRKKKATESDVRAAYRLLLMREPDPAGFKHFMAWIDETHASPAQLAELFLCSPEFLQHHSSVWQPTEHRSALVKVDVGTYSVFASERDTLIGASLVQANGVYEPNVMDHFKASLRAGDHVLDIGANIGIFTMAAASLVGPSGRVVAVEPLPANHRSLYAGILHNGFENVSVLPFAASDRPGLIPAVCAVDSSNGIVGARAQGRSEEYCVPIHRLDDVLATLPRLDVVKIDIEGHEPAAWRGMKGLIDKHRPIVFSEFSPIAMRNVGHDAIEYLSMLFAFSTRIRVMHRDVDVIECIDAESVMREWREANRRAGLDGALHLDLQVFS
jgi:FkbM family methyltransferase